MQLCEPGRVLYLNHDWQFTLEYRESLHQPDCNDSDLETVCLPHTTRETPFHYFDESIYQHNSAYRRVLKADDSWRGKYISLTVEAAGHLSEVFLNGVSLHTHFCGYTSYRVDLTEHLVYGEDNILVIRVDSSETLDQPPFGHVIDYMTFGGLYREVYLEIREPSRIVDLFPRVTSLAGRDHLIGDVVLRCSATLANAEGTQLCWELFDADGAQIASFDGVDYLAELCGVKLWSPEQPVRYTLRATLRRGETVLDVCEEMIGFRTAVFLRDGFYLNGRKYKLRGLNRHQSYPYVGYAMPASMQRNDAKILKNELCVNAVRTSHYPQSHHFLDQCDRLGLLVFTEIPGWQHIGGDDWKKQAVQNTRDMVLQYRNHPSIVLWGVRINESLDDDAFYRETNAAARELDDSRQTSGVRYLQKSSLLEDVYAYNDFFHDGTNAGVMKKKQVTGDMEKGYLISEHNGHMYPTKSFDAESHRASHMLRHARVLNDCYAEEDIAGVFGWCMFDYNTHRDFGSGDRICYHGVMDMFRNPKMAAALYASQRDCTSEGDTVLEISSAMDIGEHPACLLGDVYAITNADGVRVYKNDQFVGEYTPEATPFGAMPHGPIRIDDFIGGLMEKNEGYSHRKAEDIKKVLLAANRYGLAHLPGSALFLAAKCMLVYGMKMHDAVELYNKYVGNWGGSVTTYRFEAVVNGEVVKTVEKRPVTEVSLAVDLSHQTLVEDTSYDVAAVRIRVVSGDGAVLPLYQEPIRLRTEGSVALIGPNMITPRGGMCGTYIKSVGKEGAAVLHIEGTGFAPISIPFAVEIR